MTGPVLRRHPPRRAGAPRLDPEQSRVVDAPGGPLLVLAGPGTGKTTTLVEAVVDRVERRGLRARAGAGADLQPQGRARAARAGDRPAGAHDAWRAGDDRSTPTPTRCCGASSRRGRASAAAAAGPEQDLEVARLLAGELDDGGLRWPEALRPALPLRGLPAPSCATCCSGRRSAGSTAGCSARSASGGAPGVVGAGGFLDAYEGRFALDPSAEVLDHSGPGPRGGRPARGRRRPARARARGAGGGLRRRVPGHRPRAGAAAARRWRATGRDLVVVGDPDQSIYAFRGADVRGILDFPDTFRTARRQPAPTVSLRTGRRSGPALLGASRAVAARLPAGRLGPGFRDLRRTRRGPRRGAVEVLLRDLADGEAALVADVLRRAHLHDGLAWSDMAVLVRSTPRSLAVLRRGLLGAACRWGVPGRRGPAAPRSRSCGRCSTCSSPRSAPTGSRSDDVLALLGGPLVRADALALRRLRRALREVDLAAGGSTPSDELLVEALHDPRVLLAVPERASRPLSRLHRAGRRRARGPSRAPPRTCSGRCGRPAGWSAGWRRTACPAAAAGPWPTGRWTPCWPCSTPLPATSTGCRTPRCSASSPTSTRRRCPGTRWPSAPPRATASGS
jgi:hypothetical protein